MKPHSPKPKSSMKTTKARHLRRFSVQCRMQDDTLSYVIWTTTPWTLPANLAIAFNPQEHTPFIGTRRTDEKYLVAEKLAENFQKSTGIDLEYVLGVEGSPLRGSKAHHPWAGRQVPLFPAGLWHGYGHRSWCISRRDMAAKTMCSVRQQTGRSVSGGFPWSSGRAGDALERRSCLQSQ